MDEPITETFETVFQSIDNQIRDYRPFGIIILNLKPFATDFIESERDKLLEKALYKSSRFEYILSNQQHVCLKTDLYTYLKRCFNYESMSKNNLDKDTKSDLLTYTRFLKEASVCQNALSSIELVYSHCPEYFYDNLGLRYIGDNAQYWYDTLYHDYISISNFVFLLLPYIYLFDQRIEACDQKRLHEMFTVEFRKVKFLPMINLTTIDSTIVDRYNQLPFTELFDRLSIDEILTHVNDLRANSVQYRCDYAGLSVIDSAFRFWHKKSIENPSFTTKFCASLFSFRHVAI